MLYASHWTLECKDAQLVSTEMMLRFVFLGVIAALLLIGFTMSKDAYQPPQRRRQPAAPETGTSVVKTSSSAASDAASVTATAPADDTIAIGR